MKKPQSIWWHLSMRYHLEPYVGHTYTNRSRECWECQQIAALFERAAPSTRQEATRSE